MIRAARLPDDEPAILSFIWGLQKFENAFEPNRRLDPAFAPDIGPMCKSRRPSGARSLLRRVTASRSAGLSCWKSLAICLWQKRRRHGFVAELFVEPLGTRARNGRALIAACEDWTRARGMAVLIIGVLSGNDKAAAMYQRDGFAPYNLFLRKYL